MPVLESLEYCRGPQIELEVDPHLGVVAPDPAAEVPTPIFQQLLQETGIDWLPQAPRHARPTEQRSAPNAPDTGFVRDFGTMRRVLDALHALDVSAQPAPALTPLPEPAPVRNPAPGAQPAYHWPDVDPDRRTGEEPTLTDIPVISASARYREAANAAANSGLSPEQERAFQRFWDNHPEGPPRHELASERPPRSRWLGALVRPLFRPFSR